MLVETLVK